MSVDFDSGDDDVIDVPADEGGNKYQFTPGDYPVVCVGLARHKKPGKDDSIKWTCRILPEGGVGQGLTFDMYTGLGPKGVWRTHDVAKAFGVTAVDEKGNLKINKKELIGRRAMGTFKDETYNGRVSTKLDVVTAHPAGFGPIELTPDDMPW